MKDFFRLLELAREYRGRMAVAFIASLLYGGAQAALLYVIQYIVDQVLQNGEGLIPVSIAILGLSLVKGVGSYAASVMMTDVGQRV
ncbi:MAG: hypothetical protein JF610_15465, partial [Acidobacteria bacterium]|nr:hypothetical protein [Acidobacteriota bacterium]